MNDSSLTTTSEPAVDRHAADPDHNPAYPPRTHFGEWARLDEALRSCNERVSAALQKLSVLANHPDKARFERLYHQLQGARDQVAEAVRRLPLEVGVLYHEDHERLEQAMAAMERTWHRWEAAVR